MDFVHDQLGTGTKLRVLTYVARFGSVGAPAGCHAGLPPAVKADRQRRYRSFGDKLRAECLNTHWFVNLDDARRKCEPGRRAYEAMPIIDAIRLHPMNVRLAIGAFRMVLNNRMAWSSSAIATMPRIATMATMASRLETFQKVLPVIHSQVDHVFIYLDGYNVPPSFLASFDRITVRIGEELCNLHCNSRYLCLQELNVPTVVTPVDDDIIYPPNYISRLVGALQRLGGQAIVGVHGRIFTPPHKSYVRDVAVLHFTHQVERPCHVHELGTGTSAFVSSNFNANPKDWGRTDMGDIDVAIEAQQRGLPRIVIARTRGWLKAFAETQSDSLWTRTTKDDSEQSRRMCTLLSLYANRT